MKFGILLLLPLSFYIGTRHVIPRIRQNMCKDNENCVRKETIHQTILRILRYKQNKLDLNTVIACADGFEMNFTWVEDDVIIQQTKILQNSERAAVDSDETFYHFDMDINRLRNVASSYYEIPDHSSGSTVSIWNYNKNIDDYDGWSTRFLFNATTVIGVAVSAIDKGWIAVQTGRFVHLYKCKENGFSWVKEAMIEVGGTTMALSNEGPLRLAVHNNSSQSIVVYETPWVVPISELRLQDTYPGQKRKTLQLSLSFRHGDYITFGYNLKAKRPDKALVRVCQYSVGDMEEMRVIDNPGGYNKGFSTVDQVGDVFAIGISGEVIIYREDQVHSIESSSSDRCGTSLSLSFDATRIAVGCPGDSNKLHIYDDEEADNHWNLNSFSSTETYGDHVKISADGNFVMTLGENTKFVHEWVEQAEAGANEAAVNGLVIMA